ncbi:MAG: orotidine-5'-phosphate decarboxylase [Chlamydiota bacterium]|jgi:uridine monophosphate synthetase
MSLSFFERSKFTKNPIAKKLFLLMEQKKTNLCASADLTKAQDLLKFANSIGPEICLLKTHIDILEDFSDEVIHKLTALSQKHQFLLFEDRKFADIGNTARLQYEKGIFNIASWADIINAHVLPGKGIIEGLLQSNGKKEKGLLLLAQMSSQGNLITESYTTKAVEMALAYEEFVIGFISQEKISDHPAHLHLTPGVSLQAKSDSLSQSYRSIDDIIFSSQSDIIIVGRSLYMDKDPLKRAKMYRKKGWESYAKRISSNFHPHS